jgi:predicted nucleotide-binding protein (sugar kinase/HSP70/actin superfamily)
MPFAAPALAAAVARQTGCEVIVPPSPGTVGALGIALLAGRDEGIGKDDALRLDRVLDALLEGKDGFICKSVEGCGGSGNKCRIDRIRTLIDGRRRRFTWGGACSLQDSGPRGRKLPERAPDPFREREQLVRSLLAPLAESRPGRQVALTDELALKELLPLFATFLHRLGFQPLFHPGAGREALKRGILQANVPYCAPMQQYQGLVAEMAEQQPDYLFLPMMRRMPLVRDEPRALCCPITQASPDLVRWDLGMEDDPRVISPLIDLGSGNTHSPELAASCERLAKALKAPKDRWRSAFQAAVKVQDQFDRSCRELGRRALRFAAEQGITPVVVLGRTYSIYNRVLSSNVPAILREQGALPIPVDCYPVDEDVPVFADVYWGHAQRSLRAAHQVRRSDGVYSIFCSNYSCGPDSFTISIPTSWAASPSL